MLFPNKQLLVSSLLTDVCVWCLWFEVSLNVLGIESHGRLSCHSSIKKGTSVALKSPIRFSPFSFTSGTPMIFSPSSSSCSRSSYAIRALDMSLLTGEREMRVVWRLKWLECQRSGDETERKRERERERRTGVSQGLTWETWETEKNKGKRNALLLLFSGCYTDSRLLSAFLMKQTHLLFSVFASQRLGEKELLVKEEDQAEGKDTQRRTRKLRRRKGSRVWLERDKKNKTRVRCKGMSSEEGVEAWERKI